MDRLQVFPGSAIPFALGLYNVTMLCSGSFDDGPGDIFVFNWRPEEHFLP